MKRNPNLLAIHVIEKGLDRPVTKTLDPKKRTYKSTAYVISESNAHALIGGMIYIHKKQKEKSFICGKIIDFEKVVKDAPADGANKKTKIRFIFEEKDESFNKFRSTGWSQSLSLLRSDDINDAPDIATDFAESQSLYGEGNPILKSHMTHERDPEFIKLLKRTRLNQTGKLQCEVCDLDFEEVYGELGRGFIEAHHKTPVSQLANGGIPNTKPTRASDMALLCSNCHRMIHRLMANSKGCDISDLKKILNR